MRRESIFVAIRGTDVDVDDIWGILEQIWEDLDVADQQPMPWALGDAGARRERARWTVSTIIQGLTDSSSRPISKRSPNS